MPEEAAVSVRPYIRNSGMMEKWNIGGEKRMIS
jgi:hypothetical protein